jgi:hypothetical protein
VLVYDGSVGALSRALVLLVVPVVPASTLALGCAALASLGDLQEVACAVDCGTAPDASGTDGGGLLADGPVNVVDGCGVSGCVDVPSGFSVVAFAATGAGQACPGDFGQPTDTVEGPTAGSGACTCSCSMTTPPTCPANGAITNTQDTDNSATCGNPGQTYANQGCGTEGLQVAFGPNTDHDFTPPGPTGGACTAAATNDDTKVTFAAEGRLCEPTTLAECGGQVCVPSLSTPFAACVAATGDVPCPASFPTKHLVGSGATVTCSAGCTCSVTGTCSGTLDYYTSTDCTGSVAFQVPATGQCVSTASGGSYGSHQYVPGSPSGAACAGGGSTSPGTPTLNGATTVCCN